MFSIIYRVMSCVMHSEPGLPMPSTRNAEYKKWREEWLSEITKTRVIDKVFQKQINSNKAFICEKHFKPEDVELCKYCFCYVRFFGCQHRLCQQSLVCLNFITLL